MYKVIILSSIVIKHETSRRLLILVMSRKNVEVFRSYNVPLDLICKATLHSKSNILGQKNRSLIDLYNMTWYQPSFKRIKILNSIRAEPTMINNIVKIWNLFSTMVNRILVCLHLKSSRFNFNWIICEYWRT